MTRKATRQSPEAGAKPTAALVLRRKFKPLERERAEFLSTKLKRTIKQQSAFSKLAKRLLAIGGITVVAPGAPEPLLQPLLARGEALLGRGALLRTGRVSDCHRNSSRIWRRSPKRRRIATGYALSADGLWREHTWVLEGARVIETTEGRLVYFGFVLTARESRWFARTFG